MKNIFEIFWSKTSIDDKLEKKYHLLIYHLIDVYSVSKKLLTYKLNNNIDKFLVKYSSKEKSENLIPFICGLHDIGKLSPVFQNKLSSVEIDLKKQGYSFANTSSKHHACVSYRILRDYFKNNESYCFWRDVSAVIGGHHGSFYVSSDISYTNLSKSNIGKDKWETARKEHIQKLAQIAQINNFNIIPDSKYNEIDKKEINSFLFLLAGLTSVADWIGSNQDYFNIKEELIDLNDYLKLSENKADIALKELGWIQNRPKTKKMDFKEYFGFKPNNLQKKIVQLIDNIKSSGLIIIEAPMGEGKTEAAYTLADHFINNLKQNGLYAALPTQATSNQMYKRIGDFLKNTYPNTEINYLLIHGQSLIDENYKKRIKMNIHDIQNNEMDSLVVEKWFLQKKKKLTCSFWRWNY